MGRWGFRLCTVVFFLSFNHLISANTEVGRLSLEDRWRAEQYDPYRTLNQLRAVLKGKPVLFVKGILNELSRFAPVYYTANAQVIKDLGMQSYAFGPPSQGLTHLNGDLIVQEINKIYEMTGQPVLLIGHSKGGAEVLSGYLRHPEIASKVDRVVIIQGAIGGSPLADANLSWRMCPLSILVCPKFRSFFEWPGMADLTPDKGKENFDFALWRQRFAEGNLLGSHDYFSDSEVSARVNEINNKIYYVRTREDFGNLGFGMRAILKFMGRDLRDYDGDGPEEGSDGMVLVKAQKLDGIGHDLGVLPYVDHLALTISGFNHESDDSRKAFMRALFELIYDILPPHESETRSSTPLYMDTL